MDRGILSHRAGGNDAFRAVLGQGLPGMLVLTQGGAEFTGGSAGRLAALGGRLQGVH